MSNPNYGIFNDDDVIELHGYCKSNYQEDKLLQMIDYKRGFWENDILNNCDFTEQISKGYKEMIDEVLLIILEEMNNENL